MPLVTFRVRVSPSGHEELLQVPDPPPPGPAIDSLTRVTFVPVNAQTVGAAYTIDWRANLRHRLTLTANTALTFINPPGPCNGMIWLVQDGAGAHVPVFSGGTESPPDMGIDPAPGGRTLLGCAFDGAVWTIVSSGGPMVSPAVLVPL